MIERAQPVLIALAVLAALAVALFGVTRAYAKAAPIFTGLVAGVAVGGYDPVSYFTEGKAVKGSDAITLEHEGVMWRFASEANREAFKAEPGKYQPQYGGYCAYAVSQGYTAKGDPEAWSIFEGKLYLNYDKNVRATWLKNAAGFVLKADANWPGVLN